jgi:hypothetical protein
VVTLTSICNGKGGQNQLLKQTSGLVDTLDKTGRRRVLSWLVAEDGERASQVTVTGYWILS